MILYCIQATCYPCDDLWRVKLMAFLVPCSFSFTNKDCQGLHSKYKIYSLQWKNVTRRGNKDVKLPALVRRTKQITKRHNLISGLCWFHGRINTYLCLMCACEYCVLVSTSYRSMGASCCSCCSLMVWYSFSNFFSFFWLICWAVRAE